MFVDTEGGIYSCGASLFGSLGLSSDILRIKKQDFVHRKHFLRRVRSMRAVEEEEDIAPPSPREGVGSTGRVAATFVAVSGQDWKEELVAHEDGWGHLEVDTEARDTQPDIGGLAGDVNVLEPRRVALPPTAVSSCCYIVVEIERFECAWMDRRGPGPRRYLLEVPRPGRLWTMVGCCGGGMAVCGSPLWLILPWCKWHSQCDSPPSRGRHGDPMLSCQAAACVFCIPDHQGVFEG